MKQPLFILDAGHGGIISGRYQTAGKRSPIWSDGSQLFEGEFNRAIVAGISQQLTQHNIKHHILVPEQRDIHLRDRVRRANRLAKHYSRYQCILISVHANAGGGSGFEVFTSKGKTRSDEIADHFALAFKDIFPNKPLRSDFRDGDYDKDRSFYILRYTSMPAILTENFFMDNEQECKEILMTSTGREKVVKYHVKGIKRVYELARTIR